MCQQLKIIALAVDATKGVLRIYIIIDNLARGPFLRNFFEKGGL